MQASVLIFGIIKLLGIVIGVYVVDSLIQQSRPEKQNKNLGSFVFAIIGFGIIFIISLPDALRQDTESVILAIISGISVVVIFVAYAIKRE